MKELKNFITSQANMDQRLRTIKKELLNDRRFLAYINRQNIQLTETLIDNSLMNLLNFNENYFKCEGCSSLEHCKQDHRGFRPELVQQEDRIHLVYKACKFQREFEYKQSVASNIHAFYMPKSILNASVNTIDIKESKRSDAINKVFSFASTYDGTVYRKGLYLYGTFGIGKTYLLAAMANEVAKKNVNVAFVYFPDLIRELKSAIGKNNLEGLMNKIKTVKVLVLDDIGAEMSTQWVRDEILGPLLQYRLLEELPTFFTSNKSMEELIRDYTRTNDGVVDTVKANRIGDRIKSLATEVYVEGKNYRY